MLPFKYRGIVLYYTNEFSILRPIRCCKNSTDVTLESKASKYKVSMEMRQEKVRNTFEPFCDFDFKFVIHFEFHFRLRFHENRPLCVAWII